MVLDTLVNDVDLVGWLYLRNKGNALEYDTWVSFESSRDYKLYFFDRLMAKRSFSCWLLISQSRSIHKSCFIVMIFTERMMLNVTDGEWRFWWVIRMKPIVWGWRNDRYWWVPFSRVQALPWEDDIIQWSWAGSSNCQTTVWSHRRKNTDQEKKRGSTATHSWLPTLIPVQIQWKITESVAITMSRKCQLLMGYCNKGLEHSNTNRIERFVIGAISSSLKVPFSSICYRLQLLAEGKRELYRYRGDESTHASSMW